ncbi:HAD domain-containing protein [Acidovorax sp. 22279]|uniref:HAD domain-containing protein n=1 Tax=Acidovorax sp. 22279 TaxID=3453900 RepID=UPI003F8768BE
MNGKSGHILYLDYDGVLHHENCWWHPRRGPYLVAPPEYKLFQHAALLQELLTPYQTVRIVLSTSWVRRYGYSRTAKYLPSALRARVIGATFHSRMNELHFTQMSRGMQVLEDVARREPARWLALDDDPEGWNENGLSNFVRTDECEGISNSNTKAELVAKLTRFGDAP